MKGTFTLAVLIGAFYAKPAFAITRLVVLSSSCVASTGIHVATSLILPFLLLFMLYRVIQLEKEAERMQVDNFLILLIKTVFYVIIIRMVVEVMTLFGVPVKMIAKDVFYCRGECDLLDAPDLPVCKGLPFEKVLKFLLVTSAFFSKSLAVLLPAVAYIVLLYKSMTTYYYQAQKGLISFGALGLYVAKDGILFAFFIVPYVLLVSFALGLEYTKIVEWFVKVYVGG